MSNQIKIILVCLGSLLLTFRKVDTGGKSIKICIYITHEFLLLSQISHSSSSVTTSLYTLVNFTCKGTGDILNWQVGGNSPNDPSNKDREISVTTTNNISVDVWSSVLTIRALPINDGITVQCTVISQNPFDFKTKGSILTITGQYYVLYYKTSFNNIQVSHQWKTLLLVSTLLQPG